MNNFYRSKDTGDIGDKAVEIFKRLAKEQGYDIKDATTQEDMHQHFDVIISKEGAEIKVEIKALKRLTRSAKSSLRDLMWVELKNVRGNPGWLYGNAKIIAQQFENYFLLVSRTLLKEFVEQRVSKIKVKSPKDAIYKIYTREKWGRKDQITLIKVTDIPAEAYIIWPD